MYPRETRRDFMYVCLVTYKKKLYETTVLISPIGKNLPYQLKRAITMKRAAVSPALLAFEH